VGGRWDEKDVPPLDGKVVLVTGANAGLGLAASKVSPVTGRGSCSPARNQHKARAAADELRAEVGGDVDVDIVALDLASLTSVSAAATVVRDRESRLEAGNDCWLYLQVVDRLPSLEDPDHGWDAVIVVRPKGTTPGVGPTSTECASTMLNVSRPGCLGLRPAERPVGRGARLRLGVGGR